MIIEINTFNELLKLREISVTSPVELIFNINLPFFPPVSLKSSLEKVFFNNHVQKIEDFSFCVNFKEVVLPETCTEINKQAFIGCMKLQKINLENVVDINKEAFKGCMKLQKINLENVVDINKEAFKGCMKLQKVDLNNISSINDRAFYGCTNLTDVNINSKNKMTFAANAFDDCLSLKNINVEFPKLVNNNFLNTYKRYITTPSTLDDLISSNRTFKQINEFYKTKKIER